MITYIGAAFMVARMRLMIPVFVADLSQSMSLSMLVLNLKWAGIKPDTDLFGI
jgi:hypothetical protein